MNNFMVIHHYFVNGKRVVKKDHFKTYSIALKHYNNVKNGATDYHMIVSLYNVRDEKYSFEWRNF